MNKKRFISYLFLLCFPITLLGQKGLNDTTYILTYDHGGLILWGGEHFIERLKTLRSGWINILLSRSDWIMRLRFMIILPRMSRIC